MVGISVEMTTAGSGLGMNQMVQAPLTDHEIQQGHAKLKQLIESHLVSYTLHNINLLDCFNLHVCLDHWFLLVTHRRRVVKRHISQDL